MTDFLNVELTATGPEEAREVVEEYVLERVEKSDAIEGCENIGFAYADDDETGEKNRIQLQFMGDVDAILESEEASWEQLKRDDYLTDWEEQQQMSSSEAEEMFGEKRFDMQSRFASASAKMVAVMYDEFESFPDPVVTYSEEREESAVDMPVGLWMLFHVLTHQMQYEVREEMDAYRQGIRYCLRNIAEHEGEKEADVALDELLETLEAMRKDVKDGRPAF